VHDGCLVFEVVGQSHLDSNIEDQEIVTNPPDICQVVEVTTESDEQPVNMSELYPLQISPVSSYAESETTDSVPSDEESVEVSMAAATRLQQTLWESLPHQHFGFLAASYVSPSLIRSSAGGLCVCVCVCVCVIQYT